MKFKTQLIVAASLFTMAACTEKKAPETQGVGTTPVNFSTPATGAQQQAGATAGLNPAHGQPGHRCDIPVGASLSSPAQPNAATSTTAPTPVVTTPAVNNTVAPGTNPPHGQPGHDCSIAVGAPLNK